ncbi:MAG: cysteine desulfurase-like protein SufS subfamily [Acidimicrobiales bacterium]|nr:cysteine desulfurase-like protein SufS subfamily [Acidimicrobiales bacterium]
MTTRERPTTSTTSITDPLDVAAIKADFPLLKREIKGRPIVYLDSAASSQKPQVVIDAMSTFYETINANVHRGVYEIAEASTNALEDARAATARFIGAASPNEIVFTKNATEGLNLVARSWGAANLRPGDAVLLTQLEHHANIVPWFQIAAEKGAEIRWIPLTADGKLDLTDLDRLLDGVKVVGLSAMSNVTGTLTPVRRIVDAAHAAGAVVCLDACQYVPHLATDVAALGADFAAFSGHKMCGPTGIGVLWGHEALLEAMPPFLGGGGMILDVSLDGWIPADLPAKFEAGTPPIAEAVGLHAAIDYLTGVGMDAVREHEVSLTAYAMRTLTARFGDTLTIHGPSEPAERGGVLSLAMEGIHPHDLSQVLDEHAVCVRPGHHCAKPLMKVLGVGATARASFYVYNDETDVDALAEALDAAAGFFSF